MTKTWKLDTCMMFIMSCSPCLTFLKAKGQGGTFDIIAGYFLGFKREIGKEYWILKSSGAGYVSVEQKYFHPRHELAITVASDI